MTFECEPNARLAIFSASYGRTQYQSVQCPQPQGVAEESKFAIVIQSTRENKIKNTKTNFVFFWVIRSVSPELRYRTRDRALSR